MKVVGIYIISFSLLFEIMRFNNYYNLFQKKKIKNN